MEEDHAGCSDLLRDGDCLERYGHFGGSDSRINVPVIIKSL